MSDAPTIEVAERKTSILLIIGIVLMPIVFAWFLLRKGYSSIARVLGFGWLIGSVFLVLVGGEKTTVSISTMSEDVRLTVEVQRTNDDRLLVFGETNLPDETNLIVTLFNEDVGYSAQDRTIVTDGRFSAGPFSRQSRGFEVGHYIARVVMPIPEVQPAEVQSVIGDKGEHLTGDLVQESSMGGKVVKYSISYTLGSEESIKQTQSDHVSLVSEVRDEIEYLIIAGRGMEQYRNTDNLATLRVCGEEMRVNQARAKKVKASADSLSMSQISLKIASAHVHSCVSCSGTALEACALVEEALDVAL